MGSVHSTERQSPPGLGCLRPQKGKEPRTKTPIKGEVSPQTAVMQRSPPCASVSLVHLLLPPPHPTPAQCVARAEGTAGFRPAAPRSSERCRLQGSPERLLAVSKVVHTAAI